MLIKATDIIGLKVLTLQEGKEIEEVDDIIYDPLENKIKALLVDPGGWFSDAKVVLFKDIKSIGKDEILVNSQDAVAKASDVSERISGIAKENKHLTHTKIVTEDGKKLGKVSDVYFDDKTGEVIEFEVTQGGLFDLASGKKKLHISDIITVGEDATIVRGYTQEEVKQQAQTQGLQGALNTAAQRSQAVFQEIRSQVTNTTRRVQRRTKKADIGQAYIQEAREQGRRLMRGTQDETERMIDDLKERYQDLKMRPETKNVIGFIQNQIIQLDKMMEKGLKTPQRQKRKKARSKK